MPPYLPEDDCFWLTWLLLLFWEASLVPWLPSRALPADYSTGMLLSCSAAAEVGSTVAVVAMRPWALVVSGVLGGDYCC